MASVIGMALNAILAGVRANIYVIGDDLNHYCR